MSKNKKYSVSVPGSLMLMGEHAVLHGKMALACAINKRIEVTLRPRQDRRINIKSELLGEFYTSLDNLPIVEPFQFVLSSIVAMKKRLSCGFDLIIKTDFSSKLGFGSSAAVTVATLAVLHWWLNQRKPQARQLFLAARRVIRKVQGIGSGADAAASIWGGVVAYRTEPLLIKKIAATLPLTVVYSGQKVGTKEVVQEVLARRKRHKKSITILENAIENSVKEAMLAIKKRDWRRLGEIVNISQGYQDALGVNALELAQIIFALREARGIYGAKISGAGKGDCIIGIGKVTSQQNIDLNIIKNVIVSKDGMRFH